MADDKTLHEAVELAQKLVDKMPHWKQNILIHSASPTISVPRKPIIKAAETAKEE